MIKLPDDKIVEQKKCRPREDRVSDPVKNGANKKNLSDSYDPAIDYLVGSG